MFAFLKTKLVTELLQGLSPVPLLCPAPTSGLLHRLVILSQVMQTGWQPQCPDSIYPWKYSGKNQLTWFHEEFGAGSERHLSGIPGAHRSTASQVTSLGLALGPRLEHLCPASPAWVPAQRPHSSENYKAALDEIKGLSTQRLSSL